MDPDRDEAGRRRRGPPRVRGDGPEFLEAFLGRLSTAPCSRGWTGVHPGRGAEMADRPVFAGMDPMRILTPHGCGGPPRVRGDGPRRRYSGLSSVETAPCSRGWTRLGVLSALGFDDRPVFAGMDPLSALLSALVPRPPRVRGDGPWNAKGWIQLDETAPCSRGWTPSTQTGPAPAWDRPVFAGMDPYLRFWRKLLQRPPRVRGDGPLIARVWRSCAGTAPCSRGWTSEQVRVQVGDDDRPVFAGMDPTARSLPAAGDGPPRVRGDGPFRWSWQNSLCATAPCSRGWTRPKGVWRLDPQDRPVFAGMDPPPALPASASAGPPRVRGDGPTEREFERMRRWTAPCSRGWTEGAALGRGRSEDRPVFAGMDRDPCLW